MECTIINLRLLPKSAERILPRGLTLAIESADFCGQVEEIRIKAGRRAWICGGNTNLLIDYVVSSSELEETVMRACGGSIYSYADSMAKGYISVGDGIRVGICGEWSEGGIRKVSSIAIRIPHRVSANATEVRSLLDSFGMCRGLLIFSPPLGGKTSFLRETARLLSAGNSPLRTVVVDTRGELAYSLDGDGLCLDILSGYPKGVGLEIAFSSLGAQVVICDEISADETDAIRALHGGGVPLIASAHAADLRDLLTKSGIAPLHKDRVFGGYIRLFRDRDTPHRFFSWEEADDY